MTLGRTGGTSALLALALVLGLSAVASAATRHAAPGASGPAPCASAAPCSLFTAVSGAGGGDEVIVASGEYTDTAGELGSPAVHLIQIQPNVEVRGEAGKPRPKIVLAEGKWLGGVFEVNSEDVVAHLEITSAVASGDITQFGGTVEDLILRSTASSSGFACTLTSGTMRDTVCLSGGANMAALGTNASGPGTLTATLRNVTAIATGAGGVGLSYTRSNEGTMTVDAKSVIAKGDAKDVVARGLSTSGTPGTGGHVTINIDHSVYGTPETETDTGTGSAMINPTNILNVVPLLAADGYHELAGSQTVDAGVVDGSSSAVDVDGQNRTIDLPDIGADELGHPTTVAVACTPSKVVLTDAIEKSDTTCAVTVTDTNVGGAGFITPTGSVALATSGAGSFPGGNSCVLTAAGPTQSAGCQVAYKATLGSAGTHAITATYPGDSGHEPAHGTTAVPVSEAPIVCAATVSATVGCRGPEQRHTVRITAKPRKRTHSRRARFAFESAARARFECKLDRGRFKACNSPFRHRVRPGRHSFAVRAIVAGNFWAAAHYSWRVLPPS